MVKIQPMNCNCETVIYSDIKLFTSKIDSLYFKILASCLDKSHVHYIKPTEHFNIHILPSFNIVLISQ